MTGLCIMVISPSGGPVSPAVFVGGLAIATHGVTGMGNSVISMQNALNGTSNPGILESAGGALLGENGAQAGQVVDLMTGIRPGAVAAASMKSAGDIYDAANAINTIGNASDSNNANACDSGCK